MNASRDLSSFKSRREANVLAEAKAESAESIHMRGLLASEAGKWLFRRLLGLEDIFAHPEPKCNSGDWYRLGRRNAILEIAELIKRHGGPEALAELVLAKDFNHKEKEDDC